MLCQYRGKITDESLGYLRNLLKNGSLLFRSPHKFNDPFDCYPTTWSEAPDGVLPHGMVDQFSRTQQVALGQVVGVACLMSHPDSMLMWSHYGDQHRGFCVGFDEVSLKQGVRQNDQGIPVFAGPTKVEYHRSRPDEECASVYTTKSADWSYEDEYRLFSSVSSGQPSWGPGVWPIPIKSIREIILGARISDKNKTAIVSILQKQAPNIQCRKAMLHAREYKLVIDDVSNVPDEPQISGSVCLPDGSWKKIK